VRLILIRHGEAHHSFNGLIAGDRGCTGLTERGIAQSRALARRLLATGELRDCVALLSSPVRRARQTADLLAAALPGAPLEEMPDLRELHPGDADGLSWDDYRARFGAFDLRAEPQRPFAPGGETWDAFTTRVRATLDGLAARYAGQTVAAVTHAGFIVVATLLLFAIPRPGTGARIDPEHTALTEWQVTNGIWRLVRYNDAYHLLG
jgi:broad specificity phosphatase PhoE